MLPFGVTIPATVPQGSEIPEGLRNNSVYKVTDYRVFSIKFNRTTCFGLLRPSSGPKSWSI